MQEPRRGALTGREGARDGRAEANEARAPDATTDERPVAVLVEDDPAALSALSMWLEGEGFGVRACATFAKARAELTGHAVAALLTDVRLAEYNGLHLVQVARSLHPAACLVVFSGYADDVLEATARAAGAAWFLKPIDLRALQQHLWAHTPGAPGSLGGAG